MVWWLCCLADCNTVSISSYLSTLNGDYSRQGVLGNRSYWKKTVNSTRYLYFASAYLTWVLDNDLNTSSVNDYINAKPQFPPSGAQWRLNPTYRPDVVCSDSGELLSRLSCGLVSSGIPWYMYCGRRSKVGSQSLGSMHCITARPGTRAHCVVQTLWIRTMLVF